MSRQSDLEAIERVAHQEGYPVTRAIAEQILEQLHQQGWHDIVPITVACWWDLVTCLSDAFPERRHSVRPPPDEPGLEPGQMTCPMCGGSGRVVRY